MSAPAFTQSEKFLLDWLSKEDWSSYGECYGKDFDNLQRLGLVERKPSNRSNEHEYFDLCRLTDAGHAARGESPSTHQDRGNAMSKNLVGTGCDDCVDGTCTMNCSSATWASGSEWIAASIWAGVFPAKATADQVQAYRNVQDRDNVK